MSAHSACTSTGRFQSTIVVEVMSTTVVDSRALKGTVICAQQRQESAAIRVYNFAYMHVNMPQSAFLARICTDAARSIPASIENPFLQQDVLSANRTKKGLYFELCVLKQM